MDRNGRIRRPAVSGMFYPDQPEELSAGVASYLLSADPAPVKGPIKAVIAPHAGYPYSGPIAGVAYEALRREGRSWSRVVIAGPSHHVAFDGVALPSHDAFRTPLGSMAVDRDMCSRLLESPSVTELDEAHRREHGIEVHLPFLQAIDSGASIVPLVVGAISMQDMANVLNLAWGGPETLIIISSDLSHYFDYATAYRLDRQTADSIEALAPNDIRFDQACGRLPIQGLLIMADRTGLYPMTLDLRNSGDTAGSRDRVVGYGAWVFHG